jgi:hypothetical protein
LCFSVVVVGASSDRRGSSGSAGRSSIGSGGGGGRDLDRESSGLGLAAVGAETLSASTVIELAVPNHLIGAIVGIQGAKLAEINELSGAVVRVSTKYVLPSDTCCGVFCCPVFFSV